MKKICLAIMFALIAAALFAQFSIAEWTPESFESEITAGTFTNEIDQAFIPNADFGTYDQQFIFGGLGNPKDINPIGNGSGISFGYYRPGKMPMSFYTTFSAGPINRPRNHTEKTWTDNQHKKLASTKKTTYNRVPAFSTYDGTFRFLTAFGSSSRLVTGLYFRLQGNNSNFVSNNFTKIVDKDHVANTETVESKVNMTAAPNITSGNYKTGQPGTGTFTNVFVIGVPIAFRTGDLAHTLNIELNGDVRNQNAKYYKKGNTGEIKFNSVGYRSDINLGASYEVEIPVADSEEDYWFAGGTFGLNFINSELRHTYSNSGTKVEAKYKQTSAPKLGFGMSVSGGRLFAYASPKKSIMFNIKPTAAFMLTSNMTSTSTEGYNEKITATYKDNSDDLSYKKTDKTGFHQNTTTISTELAAPMGIKILPEGWKFGFLLGADVSARWSITASWNRSNNHRRNITTTENGTTTVENNYPGNSYDAGATYTNNSITLSEKHSLGITMPFEGGAHVDLMFTGNNITMLSSIKIQAFIPLGAPKK